jgi:hypothetical protein
MGKWQACTRGSLAPSKPAFPFPGANRRFFCGHIIVASIWSAIEPIMLSDHFLIIFVPPDFAVIGGARLGALTSCVVVGALVSGTISGHS